MTRLLPAALSAFLALAFTVFSAAPAASMTVAVSGGPPAQGASMLVAVSKPEPWPADNMAVLWKGAAWPLREAAPGRYEAVIGVDLLAPAGPETLAVELTSGATRMRHEETVEIVERAFPVQRLSLPQGMAEFDNATLLRIEEEWKVMDERLSRVTVPVLWSLPFIPPVERYRPLNFGVRREINGEPRAPHTGVDIRLPEGTPVRAVADGVVALAAEQFFGGRLIVIDHGGGVFSVYMHLQRYTVAEGRRVSRGEPIGAVGATGRATGPHLHFGMRVPGGRVDPSLLFALPGK